MIPLEQSFLRVFPKPKKIRLSRQVIEVNYAHLSPFKNGGQLFFQTESSIYVWFLREPARNGICIPECYLLYRHFRERRNVIVLLPREGVLNAVVIADGELKAQVTLQGGADEGGTLDLLKREYSLNNAELVRLEARSRFSAKPADLLAFAQFELNPSQVLEEGLALVKVPIIAALVIVAGFTLYRSHQLDSIAETKMYRLNRLKRDNAQLQSSLEQVRNQGGFWRDFVARERCYPGFYRVLAQVTRVLERHGGYLNNVEYADNRVTLWTGLKSSEANIIKDLLATGLFTEVKLLSSGKEPSRPDFNTYNLSLTLKPVARGVQA
jgi:hypothetical protein